MLLSKSYLVLPAVVKQQQEDISPNHIPSLFAVSVQCTGGTPRQRGVSARVVLFSDSDRNVNQSVKKYAPPPSSRPVGGDVLDFLEFQQKLYLLNTKVKKKQNERFTLCTAQKIRSA